MINDQTSESVILIGGGGHCQSVLSAEFPYIIEGYVDPSRTACPGLPWLGTDDDFMSEHAQSPVPSVNIHIAHVGNTDLKMRRNLIEKYSQYPAPAMISPHALVTQPSQIGPGACIMPRAVVNRATIEQHAVINTGAIIEHDVRIGAGSFVGPGAIICGGTTIGQGVYIGAGAIIRNNINIVNGAVVGMGAVVVKDILQPGTYIGNPAKPLAK